MKLRITLTIAIVGLLFGLAWLARNARGPVAELRTPLGQTTPGVPDVAHQIAEARASVSKQRTAKAIVMPAKPPPLGIPSWATRLPQQPAQGLPVPRGSAPGSSTVK